MKETPAVSLESGKVIDISVNVKHWHGAKKDSWFSHIAIDIPGEDTKNEVKFVMIYKYKYQTPNGFSNMLMNSDGKFLTRLMV